MILCYGYKRLQVEPIIQVAWVAGQFDEDFREGEVNFREKVSTDTDDDFNICA